VGVRLYLGFASFEEGVSNFVYRTNCHPEVGFNASKSGIDIGLGTLRGRSFSATD
jgi:hypothetical protein